IRPNLVLLVASLLVWAFVRDLRASPRRLSYSGPIAIGAACAAAGIAALFARMYGSPLESGYGSVLSVYSLTNAPANLALFSTWTFETQTPAIAAAVLFFVAPKLFAPGGVALPRLLTGGTIAGVSVSYLFYLPFDAWWYLRFLLPMWPVLMILTALAIDAVLRQWRVRLRQVILAAFALLLAWHGVTTSIDAQVLR